MRYVNNDPKWIGQKFGRLTVIGFKQTKSGKYNAFGWECKCDCGNTIFIARPRNVKCGQTRSCGCIKREIDKVRLGESRRTHGKSKTRLYGIWSKMKERCDNENTPAYHNYGGRGVKVCEEWHDNFQAFYDWAIVNGYDDTLTIERKDNNKGYSPDNCCWITREEQARNKRNIQYVLIDGEKLPLKTACEKLGLPYKAVHLRVARYGMSIDEAIRKPFKDKSKTLSAKCKEAGLPYGTVFARIKSGWSEERALSEPVHKNRKS